MLNQAPLITEAANDYRRFRDAANKTIGNLTDHALNGAMGIKGAEVSVQAASVYAQLAQGAATVLNAAMREGV